MYLYIYAFYLRCTFFPFLLQALIFFYWERETIISVYMRLLKIERLVDDVKFFVQIGGFMVCWFND